MDGGDGVGVLLEELRTVARRDYPRSAFCVGTVKRVKYSKGKLDIFCNGLLIEKDDIYLNPEMDHRWDQDTDEDDGAPEKLRAGDRVVMLTLPGENQDQCYYLVCKAVKA